MTEELKEEVKEAQVEELTPEQKKAESDKRINEFSVELNALCEKYQVNLQAVKSLGINVIDVKK